MCVRFQGRTSIIIALIFPIYIITEEPTIELLSRGVEGINTDI
jgi:hypothetical protein